MCKYNIHNHSILLQNTVAKPHPLRLGNHEKPLLHLHAGEGVGLAIAEDKHLPVAEEFAGGSGIGSRGVREVCAYVGIVLHKADGLPVVATVVVRVRSIRTEEEYVCAVRLAMRSRPIVAAILHVAHKRPFAVTRSGKEHSTCRLQLLPIRQSESLVISVSLNTIGIGEARLERYVRRTRPIVREQNKTIRIFAAIGIEVDTCHTDEIVCIGTP